MLFTNQKQTDGWGIRRCFCLILNHLAPGGMKKVSLTDLHDLAIQFLDKKVRLAVSGDGVENVCRLETLKNLNKFAASSGGHQFNGRLQLHKDETGIKVIVKGGNCGNNRRRNV